MIHVERVPEPPSFPMEVQRPGEDWLAAHPDEKSEKMPPLWSTHRRPLAEGFEQRCGYSAMHLERGTVDHYLSRSSPQGRPLTYRWSNYRFASEEMNQLKGTWDTRILDPFEIEDGWFEIQLPSLQLVMVAERIPFVHRDRARFTLKTLRLEDGDAVIQTRASWYRRFLEGTIALAALFELAPLVARAVKIRLDQIPLAAFEDERTPFQRFLESELTLKGLRRDAPRIAEQVDKLLPPPGPEEDG